MAGAWHEQPAFIGALAGRVAQALARLPRERARTASPVLLTAHSLPRRVADQEPEYLGQLRGDGRRRCRARRPAGRPLDVLLAERRPRAGRVDEARLRRPDARARRRRARTSVLVAPVQFLADHLEILYDVDIGAREQAERHGVAFDRIASLNTDPGLIAALAAVARQTLEGRRPSESRDGAESTSLDEPRMLRCRETDHRDTSHATAPRHEPGSRAARSGWARTGTTRRSGRSTRWRSTASGWTSTR